MTVLSLSESNLINSMLKNPDKDFKKLIGLIKEKIDKLEYEYQRICDNSIEGICILDSSANITFTNQCMAEIFGYTNLEMIGESFFSLMGEEKASQFKKHLKNGEEGISEKYEAKLKHINGRDIYIQVKAAPLYDEGGNYDGSVAFIEEITEKRKTEQLLKESKNKFKELYEDAPNAYFSINQKQSIIRCNKAAEKLLDYSREELLNLRVFDLYSSSEHNLLKAKKLFRRFLKGEKIQDEELIMKKKDGTPLWISLTVNPTYNDEGNIIESRSMVINITKRKFAEEKLKESEQRYRTIIQDQTELIVRWRTNGILTFVNDSYCNYFQKTREELVGASFLPLIPNEDHKMVKQNFSLITVKNPIMSHEHRVFKPGGTIAWIHWMNRAIIGEDGKIVEYQAVGRDITGRKLAEQKLKESEENYRRLVEDAQEGIWVLDENEDTIFVNTRICEMLGYTKNEMIGKNLQSFIPDSMRELIKRNRSIREKGLKETYELQLVKNDRVIIYTEVKATPIVDENRNYRGFFAYITDVTSRKIIERNLKESEEKYRNLFEKSPNAIVLLDFTGNIMDCNRATQETFGYSKEDLIGQNYLELPFYSKNMKNQLKDRFQAALKKTDIELQEFKVKKKDGNIARIKAETTYVSVGDQNFFQVLIQDITEQKQAEQKLKESEENFRTITEDSHLAITILQDDLIKYTNQKMADLFGYDRNEMLAWAPKEYIKTIAADSQEFVIEQERKKQIGDPDVVLRYPIHCVKSSGEEFWVDNISTTITYKGHPADLVTIIDNTEKRKAEEKLKVSEEKYRNLVETSSMGLLEIDFYQKKLAYINPKLLEIIGYSYEELIEENSLQKFIYPEDLKEIDFSNTDLKLEFRVVTKDGKIKWLSGDSVHFYDENGNLIYIRIWLQDISETKNLEEIKTNLLIRFSHEFKTPLISIKGFADFLLKEYSDKLDKKIVSFLKNIKIGANKLTSLTNSFLESSQLDKNLVRLKFKRVNILKLVENVLKGLEGIIKSRHHVIDLKLKQDIIIECDPEKIYITISNLVLNAAKYTPRGGFITISSSIDNGFAIISVKDNGIGLTNSDLKNIFKPFGKIERYGQGLDVVTDGIGMGLFITKELVELHKGNIWAESAGRNKGSIFTLKIPIFQ